MLLPHVNSTPSLRPAPFTTSESGFPKAQTAISAPKADADYSLSFIKAAQKGTPDYWISLPTHMKPDAVPLVAIHGIHRGARQQAISFAAQAAHQGRPVIAPLFDTTHWKDYQKAAGKSRADLGLLALLTEARLRLDSTFRKIDLVGYSGGAQFSHRFALLYPHLVRKLNVIAAGWYTLPEARPFPYGIQPSKITQKTPKHKTLIQPNQTLTAFLSLDIQVYIGDQDIIRDANLRQGAEIDHQQGFTRLERAQHWVKAINATAQASGISRSPATLTLLPGAGHDFQDCLAAGDITTQVLT